MPASRRFLLPLIVLGTATFTTVASEMMPAGVLDVMSNDLGVSEAATGLLVTGWAIVIVLTSIPLVRATIRWHRTSVLLASIGVLAVANLVTAVASSYPVALSARLLGAAAHGAFWAVVVGYVASLVPAERVGRALTIVLAGPTLAGLIALPIGSELAHRLGWRPVFATLGLLCLVCLAAIAALVPRVEATTSPTERGRWDRSARSVLIVAASGALSLIGYYAVFTFIVPISAAHGIEVAAVPAVLLASGIGGLAGVLVAGRIVDRWPTAALPAASLTLAAALAAMTIPGGLATYLLVAVAWGALIGILPVALQAGVMRVASERFRDTAGSVLITTLNIGIGIGAGLGSLASSLALLPWLPLIAAAIAATSLAPLAVLAMSSRPESTQRDCPQDVVDTGACAGGR